MRLPSDRLDGYVRVSVVGGRSGDRFQSPEQQRDTITAWAKAQGVEIAAWHEDLDRSGGTMDRPGMNEALARVEAGVTGGIVVARLDRFARTVIGGLTTIQTLHERGARVVSVAEALDPATPIGRAMLGLLLIMAEWQRDQANEALAAAQSRAAKGGRFPGKPAYGYRKDHAGQTFIDHEQAAIIRSIFGDRAEGVGWRSIADRLTREGVPAPRGGTVWAASTVNGIIRSEAYLGTFIGPRGLRVENAWTPLIDRDLWMRANAVRGVRDDGRRHHDRLLAGVARCAGCRRVMVRAINPGGFVSYACPTRGCRGKTTIGAHLIDAYVAAMVDERLAQMTLRPRTPDDAGEGERLAAARDAAVTELEAWRDDVGLRGALGDTDWREGMLARARARDDAEAELHRHRAERAAVTGALPEGVLPSLDRLPWEYRRRVVEALLHSVWVRRSRHRGSAATPHVGDRLRVVWADDRDRPSVLSGVGGPGLGPVVW